MGQTHPTLTKKLLKKRHKQHPQDKKFHTVLEKKDGTGNMRQCWGTA